MTDQPQGGGWWQASDGKWYPPEQHPSFQPQPSQPTPTAPPKSPNRTGLIVAGVVAAVALIAIAVFVLGGDDDGDTATSSDDPTEQSEPSDTSEPDSSDPTDESDNTDEVVPRRTTGGTVEDPTLDYSLMFPDNWAATPLSPDSDISEIADVLFPDEPDKAAAFEQYSAAIPRGVSLFALDIADSDTPSGIGTNMSAIAIPGRVTLDDAEDQLPQGVETFGAEVTDVSRFDAGDGESVRVEYSLDLAGQTVYGVQFGVIFDDQGVAFTFTGFSADRYAEFDSIMQTLAVLR